MSSVDLYAPRPRPIPPLRTSPPLPPLPSRVCRYSVYSYGGGQSHGDEGNDGSNVASSRARASIRSLVPSFVDLYSAGYADAAAWIREKHVDILVDLQGHTLGGRGEIAAAHPAPIQVDRGSGAAVCLPAGEVRWGGEPGKEMESVLYVFFGWFGHTPEVVMRKMHSAIQLFMCC